MAGVTNDGVLDTDAGGGGGGTVSIGSGGATDASVLNTAPVGTEYGLAVRLVGATGGGGPATIANGADVAEGNTADAAVVTDTTGTLSGKLRGLVKWAFERMPASLGQKIMAESFPVTIASDQPTIQVDIQNVDVEVDVIITGTAVDVPVFTRKYTIQLDEASSTITYVGEAAPGSLVSDPVWRIKRLNSTSGLVVEWANAISVTFTVIWNDRVTYTYS